MPNPYLKHTETIDLLRTVQLHVVKMEAGDFSNAKATNAFLEEAIDRMENEKGNPGTRDAAGHLVASEH